MFLAYPKPAGHQSSLLIRREERATHTDQMTRVSLTLLNHYGTCSGTLKSMVVCSHAPLVVSSCVPALWHFPCSQNDSIPNTRDSHSCTRGSCKPPSPNEWSGTSEGSIAAAPAAADAKAPHPLGGPRGERGGGRRGRRVDRRLAARAPGGSCAAALAGKARFNDVRGPRRKGTLDFYTAVLKTRFRCYYLVCMANFGLNLANQRPNKISSRKSLIHVNHGWLSG